MRITLHIQNGAGESARYNSRVDFCNGNGKVWSLTRDGLIHYNTVLWILKEDVRKMVYMRVFSSFFFCAQLCNLKLDVASPTKITKQSHQQTTCVILLVVMRGCARIDNNWREYCVVEVAKDGVHACMLRIFFFGCTTVQVWWWSHCQTQTKQIIALIE